LRRDGWFAEIGSSVYVSHGGGDIWTGTGGGVAVMDRRLGGVGWTRHAPAFVHDGGRRGTVDVAGRRGHGDTRLRCAAASLGTPPRARWRTRREVSVPASRAEELQRHRAVVAVFEDRARPLHTPRPSRSQRCSQPGPRARRRRGVLHARRSARSRLASLDAAVLPRGGRSMRAEDATRQTWPCSVAPAKPRRGGSGMVGSRWRRTRSTNPPPSWCSWLRPTRQMSSDGTSSTGTNRTCEPTATSCHARCGLGTRGVGMR